MPKKLGNKIFFTYIGFILTACNSGSGTSTENNNNIVSITPQILNNVAIDSNSVNYGSQQALTIFTNIAGNYLNPDLTESDFQIANQLNTKDLYNFDVNSTTGLAQSVSAYDIIYTTPGQPVLPYQSVETNVSGLVIIPNNIPIKGVVIYFKPTTWGKNEVPSCLGSPNGTLPTVSANIPTYCNITALDNVGAGMFMTLAHLFAGNGYAVVAPDYLGQGVDYNNVHPYVAFPEVNATSAFNMLPALRKILNESAGVTKSTKLPLFITGFSEGAGYALKASQLAQTSSKNFLSEMNLDLKITSPQEGAYSLIDQFKFEFTNNNDGIFNCSNNPEYNCGNTDMMKSGQTNTTDLVQQMNNWNIGSATYSAAAKPLLFSYILTSIIYYDLQNSESAYNYTMNHQFWSSILMPNESIANLYQLYSGVLGASYTGPEIESAISANTTTINNYDPVFSPNITIFTPLGNESATLTSYNWGLNNNASNFANQSLVQDPTFESILLNSSTYNWHTDSPINFIHMNYDSVVTVINTYQAYSCMKYGTSFTNSGYLVNSSAPCSASVSGDLIESTIITNFQLTNNALQLLPLFESSVNPIAKSKFWTSLSALGDNLAIPYDHTNILVLGNIVALCSFENYLKNGTNLGVCPK